MPRLRVSPSARALLSKLVPFAAVASAGCVNIGLMRWKEMRDGELWRSSIPSASIAVSCPAQRRAAGVGREAAGPLACVEVAPPFRGRCAARLLAAPARRVRPPLAVPTLRPDRQLTFALLGTGISVFKPSDPKTGRPSSEELGKSSTAGAYAVSQTAASRVLTNMCVRERIPSSALSLSRSCG